MARKFGAQATQAGVTWEEILSLWQELDRDSSFDHLWLMDHFVTGMGTAFDSAGPCMGGWTAPPAQTSGGRREFGLGAAWHTYEHGAFAIPFYTTKERLERLDEAVQVIKLLWTQPRPKFQGRYHQLDEPPDNPPNLQQPHPPILIGGSGERRTLRTVARYAPAT